MASAHYHHEIFIADDDDDVRETISLVFSTRGYRVKTFADGTSLVAASRAATPSCIILDVYMPGPSGIDVLKELNANHYPAPILVISGWGDVPTVVNAVKNGAMDFIEKPFDPDAAVAQVQQAIDAWTRRDAATDGIYAPSQFPGWERLTPREHEVLAQIAGGASSKEAGRYFGISARTVEVHRTHIMLKLGAKNAADLVRIMFSETGDRQRR